MTLTPSITGTVSRSASIFSMGNGSTSNPLSSHGQILARLLEGEEGPLGRLLATEGIENFTQAWGQLGIAQQRQFQSRAGNFWQDLLYLSHESDGVLFGAGLLNLARRAEGWNGGGFAGAIYQTLRTHPAIVPEIRRQAEARWRVLNGEGPWGERLELMAGGLAETLSDPAMIVGMSFGGLAFRLGRYWGLRAALGRGSTGWVTTRALPPLAGWAAETLAFTGSAKGMRTLMGRPEAWSLSAWEREVAGTGLVLGSLRVFGFGGGRLIQSLQRGGISAAALNRIRPMVESFGMYGGIVFSHRLQEELGLLPSQAWETLLLDSVATLFHFKMGGAVAHRLLGFRFAGMEHFLEGRIRNLEGLRQNQINGNGMGWGMQFSPAGAGAGIRAPLDLWAKPGPDPLQNLMSAALPPEGGRGLRVVRPALGVRGRGDPSPMARTEAANRLRELLPLGRVTPELLEQPGFINDLLECFGVTRHPLDQAAFQRGFEIAQTQPDRVQRMAWDVDEVSLHWALSLRNIFRGIFSRGRESQFYHTPEYLLNYEPFVTGPQVRTPWYHRVWLKALSRMRIRQEIQFHPGVRAFQLGLRLGQAKELTMATTGPAGRILMIANEDPAFKMIYFGKLPHEFVSIEEVRTRSNIYTREDLVRAMRQVLEGPVFYPQDIQVRDYIERVRLNPRKGQKLKHPAIATLLGKRSFSLLVDDSSSTYQMLQDLPGFTILQPPSDRPKTLRNFVLGRPQRYLDRMSNGYIGELADLLSREESLSSQILPAAEGTPPDYPHQRFAIEIPYRKFGREFILPMVELVQLSREFKTMSLPEPGEVVGTGGTLRMDPAQLKVLTGHYQRELDLLLEGRQAEARVESQNGRKLQEWANRNPATFREFLERYFHPEEQAHLKFATGDFSGRGEKFFGRLAGIVAAKRSALRLLELNPEQHGHEVSFRYGRPQTYGEARRRLGIQVLMTTQSNDGEVGIGAAVLEHSLWSSGLSSIGLDITTARGSRIWERLQVTPERHALAESAFKATFPFHSIRRFNHHRYPEVRFTPAGGVELSGKTARAARGWHGTEIRRGPLQAWGRSFQVGPAIGAWVAIPSPSFVSGVGPGQVIIEAKPDP